MEAALSILDCSVEDNSGSSACSGFPDRKVTIWEGKPEFSGRSSKGSIGGLVFRSGLGELGGVFKEDSSAEMVESDQVWENLEGERLSSGKRGENGWKLKGE